MGLVFEGEAGLDCLNDQLRVDCVSFYCNEVQDAEAHVVLDFMKLEVEGRLRFLAFIHDGLEEDLELVLVAFRAEELEESGDELGISR